MSLDELYSNIQFNDRIKIWIQWFYYFFVTYICKFFCFLLTTTETKSRHLTDDSCFDVRNEAIFGAKFGSVCGNVKYWSGVLPELGLRVCCSHLEKGWFLGTFWELLRFKFYFLFQVYHYQQKEFYLLDAKVLHLRIKKKSIYYHINNLNIYSFS